MTATRAPAQPSGFGQTSGFNSKPPSLPTCYQLRVATTPAPLRPLCPAMLGPPLPLPSKSLSYSLPSWHPPSRPRPSLTIGPSRTACLVAGDPMLCASAPCSRTASMFLCAASSLADVQLCRPSVLSLCRRPRGARPSRSAVDALGDSVACPRRVSPLRQRRGVTLPHCHSCTVLEASAASRSCVLSGSSCAKGCAKTR